MNPPTLFVFLSLLLSHYTPVEEEEEEEEAQYHASRPVTAKAVAAAAKKAKVAATKAAHATAAVASAKAELDKAKLERESDAVPSKVNEEKRAKASLMDKAISGVIKEKIDSAAEELAALEVRRCRLTSG